MNKVFTKNNKIELDSKWYLTTDQDSGIVLTFNETRQRDQTNKVEGKLVKTGKQEDYLFEEKTYHTRIAQALRYYVEKSLNNSKSLQEILEKEDELLTIIEKLDKEFRQFN